jgi:hypothetical protein
VSKPQWMEKCGVHGPDVLRQWGGCESTAQGIYLEVACDLQVTETYQQGG